MTFRLPPPARLPQHEQLDPKNPDRFTVAEILQKGVGELLEVVRGIDDPEIESYYQLVAQLDLPIDGNRLQDEITESTNNFVSSVRDDVVATERSRLQFGNRVQVPDENSPGGVRSEQISPDEKQQFLDILTNVLDVNVSIRNHSKDLPAQTVMDDILAVAIVEPVVRAQTHFIAAVKKHSMKNPLNDKRMFIHHKSEIYPSELRSGIRALKRVNDILEFYIGDPYAFAAEYCYARDPGLQKRTEIAIREVIDEEYAKCFAEIVEQRKAQQQARKVGTTVVTGTNTSYKSAARLGDLVLTVDTKPHDRLEDHALTIRELEPRIALSPLADAEPRTARVEEVEYMGQSMLIVYAYDQKLQAITDKSRAKYAKATGKDHPYDEALRTVAQRLLSGESFESLTSKNLMFIHKKNRSSVYQEVVLAATKVKHANDSKIYFTLCNASDVIPEMPTSDLQCLVVLVETDKANQMSALVRIGGAKAETVKSKRAGIR